LDCRSFPHLLESDAILLLLFLVALPWRVLEVAVFQPARGQDPTTASATIAETAWEYRKGFLKAVFFAGQVEPTVCTPFERKPSRTK